MSDATAIRSLELLFSELRAIESDFPASYAATLVYVAKCAEAGTNPTLSDIADNVGIARPAMSRAVLAMSERRGRGEVRAGTRKALGLLERLMDAQDYRMVRVRLTPKGKGLANRMALLAKA
jgi:DNA-binding MarR family transcriptional regulator